MHVAIIIDGDRLNAERPMLHRLCVGLLAEGARLTRMIPEGEDVDSDWERTIALANRIDYPPSVLPWMRRSRCERLIDRFDRQNPDIILSSGAGSWRIAMELAAELDVPIVFELWSDAAVRQVPRPGSSGLDMAYIVATQELARRMAKRVESESVAVVPLGVTSPVTSQLHGRSPGQRGIVMLGRSLAARRYKACLTALGRVMATRPDVHACVELRGPDDHAVWRLLRANDLLSRCSTFVNASAHGPLLATCDIVIRPEATGEARSILLELMGAALAVLAAPDPVLDFLIEGETAQVIEPDTPERWTEAISALLDAPETARKLGESGRKYVLARHRSSRQAESIYGLLHRMVEGDAIQLPV